MATQTTNYDFDLPTEGGDDDAWGGFLNGNWSALDTILDDMQTALTGVPAVVAAANTTFTGDNTFTGAVDLSEATVTWEAAAANIADAAVTTDKIADAAVTTAKIDDEAVTTAKLDATASAALVPSGAVMPFAMNTAPTGWLKCNGAAVSRTTYAALFSAIGTTFGAGDGSTTFNLPDLRGEFARGWDDGRGVDTSRTFGSAQGQQLEQHVHGVPHSQTSGVAAGSIIAGGNQGATTTTNTGGATSGAGTETRPRNIALLYCIKF